MASVAEDELEYESDPEDAKLSLIMRRREASDDEDDGDSSELPPRRIESRVSDSESEGAAAEYDEDDDFDEEEEDELEVEQVKIGSDVKVVGVELDVDVDSGVAEFSEAKQVVEEEEKVNYNGVDDGVSLQDGEVGENGSEVIGGKEKKENEPFAVPTAGAFYMHDDRFRDSAGGGRHRRNFGGRNLWESKDDRKWGHDKYEEMTIKERHYGEGRKASRGRNRGRGKMQGEERDYPRGNRPKRFNSDNQNNAPNNQYSGPPKDTPKNPDNAPKGVRGRGPRRYQSDWSEVSMQNKEHGKSTNRSYHSTSAKVSERTSTAESDSIAAKNQVFSSLNSASPPFYPAAPSNRQIGSTQKRDGLAAPLHQNLHSSVLDESFSMSTSNTVRGKNVSDVISMNKLYIENPAPSHTGKALTSSQLQVPVSSLTSSSQYHHSRVQGRGQTPMGKMSYQSTPQNQVYRVSNSSQHSVPQNQVYRVSNSSQHHNGQQAPAQTRQGSSQTHGRQLGQRAQASSSPDSALTTNSLEFRETKSPTESSKSNNAMVGKGKSVEGNGRGSFPYGGAQVVGASGNLGNNHGDVNFPGMPTFLPVMQFGGQHSGGMGVPAVGMAFPGYVGNPGSGNSEMTWLPVLAGPAGALGASYNSPYLSVDGAYHTRPPGLVGALSSEDNVNKPANGLMMPSQKQDLANDEFGQRQNKARRYTEMKFDQ